MFLDLVFYHFFGGFCRSCSWSSPEPDILLALLHPSPHLSSIKMMILVINMSDKGDEGEDENDDDSYDAFVEEKT